MLLRHRAIFVPSYGLVKDGNGLGLSKMSYQSIQVAANLYWQLRFDLIIISAAYDKVWEIEVKLKKDFLVYDCGVPEKNIIIVGPVISSNNEVELLLRPIDDFAISYIVAVTERHHAHRVRYKLKTEFSKSVENIVVTYFEATVFERTFEPHPNKIIGLIKEWKASRKWFWVLWNKFGLG